MGTSGMRGRESAVAFPSRMRTLGWRRSAAGSTVLLQGLAWKEAQCGAQGWADRKRWFKGSRGWLSGCLGWSE